MKVIVRPARRDEYDDVGRLTAAAYVSGGFVAADDESYLPILVDVEQRARHALLWVAEVAGKIIGAVTVAEAGTEYAEVAREGELEFRMLAVDPQAQRSGIGRALVQAVIAHAEAAAGVRAVSLSSASDMTGAHRLYGALGFSRIPERDWTVPGHDIRLLVFRRDV